jgi:RimJ/RimL family protein N-acetyltransferase
MRKLETQRLMLRPCVLQDFEAYAAMWGDPEVMRHLSGDGKPLSRFAAWQSFSGQIGHWSLRGFGMFSVIERANEDLVGCVGPWQPEGWPDFEIGWILRSQFWGRGYASEAATACLRYAFTDLDRLHVISLITPENRRSIGVAKRIGEHLEGEVRLPHLPPDKKVLQYD